MRKVLGRCARYVKTSDEYVNFSKSVGLSQQWDRVTVGGNSLEGITKPKKASSPISGIKTSSLPIKNAENHTFKGKFGVEKSDESGIMKLKKSNIFNSKSDPMYEVTGSAFDSHPNEVKKIIEQLKEWGVEVNYGSSTLGYGCIRRGQPGVLSITENASYSAWLHEFQHVKDDKEAGWDGAMVLFSDTKERERRERNAYAIEISLAKELGRDDIVKRLEANLNEEIEQIYKKAEEY
jgi:hypothetical protein